MMNTNQQNTESYVQEQATKEWVDTLEEARIAPQIHSNAEIRAVCDAMKLFAPEVVARLLLRLAPDYTAARGAFDWQPGDDPAEQTVRRIRDGGDAQNNDALLLRIDALEAENAALRAALDSIIDQTQESLQGFDREKNWGGYMRRISTIAADLLNPTEGE